MRSAVLAFAALASLVAAQDQYYTVESAPFRLILKSDNATLDGTALGACHQGAAIEGLCFTGQRVTDPASSYTTFYHNVSSSFNNSAADTPGLLGFNLNTTTMLVPSAMRLSISVTSNIANANFFPGWDAPSTLSFEQSGSMYIEAYQDDTVNPVGYFNPILHAKNWYICATRWSYSYDTLIWKIGLSGEPQNPACQYVDVIRVFL